MSTAYTFPFNGIVDRIIVPCIIDKPLMGISSNKPVAALWDTGAVITCISENLVKQLGLMAEDQKILTMADQSTHISNVFSVQITMGIFTIPFIRVCDLPMHNSGHDVIIGMDFMNKGDLSISNYKGKTMLSFREPSLSPINYVEELKKYKKIHMAWEKVGNHLCPCGSKKEWDKCHGKNSH